MVCKYCYAENADVFVGITARSIAYLEYEKYIHRTFYPYIIHPHSRFRVFWEGYFVVHIVLRLTVICFVWAILFHRTQIYQLVVLTFQVINAVDIFLMFFTGYVETSSSEVVLEPKKIARRYLKSFFVFDFLAAFPMEFLFYLNEEPHAPKPLSHACLFHSPSAFLCSLARLPIFTHYLINLSKILLWDQLLVGMILICVFLYVAVLFSANIYLCIVDRASNTFLEVHNNFLSLMVLTKDHRFTKLFDTLLLIILDSLYFEITFPIVNDLIKCVILNITFIGSALFTTYFLNYVIMRYKNQEKSLDVESQVRTFVTTKHFNSSLKNKTFLYFRILLENKYSKDDEIFNYIPDTFKGDIFYHLCLPLLKNFYCFEDLPTFVLRRLAESMEYQLHLPNEIVMSKEEPVLRMYFVQRGTVALFSANGVELYHFESGSNFNGRNFISGEMVNTNFAISIEVTEVYRLNHDDFTEIMSAFPHLFDKMNDKVARTRKDSSYFIDY